MQTLCSIVASELKRKPVIVVSALSGVTDLLLSGKGISKIRKIHKEFIYSMWEKAERRREIIKYIESRIDEYIEFMAHNEVSSKQALDKMASFGEIMSSYLISQALLDKGINAACVIASDLIVTDDNFGSAEFLPGPTKKQISKILSPLIKAGMVPVVTGFIGADKKGRVTTLGRGGSDYTASIIGFCLNAQEIQIWTDVDGIFTADPKFIDNARCLPNVSFREASELAAFGARVLHPGTIRPAVKSGIPVKVLNTFNPDCCGTVIAEKSTKQGGIKSVSFKRQITLVNLYAAEMLLQKGYLAKIFRVFANHNMSVDLVSVSEVSVSVSLDGKENLDAAVKDLNEFAQVSVDEGQGMVSMIGEGITSNSATIRRIFEILDKEKILARMISLSAANINISIVVDSKKVQKASQVLHDAFLMKRKHHKLLLSDTITPK